MNATKSREMIWGGRVTAARINAEHARKRAIKAVCAKGFSIISVVEPLRLLGKIPQLKSASAVTASNLAYEMA